MRATARGAARVRLRRLFALGAGHVAMKARFGLTLGVAAIARPIVAVVAGLAVVYATVAAAPARRNRCVVLRFWPCVVRLGRSRSAVIPIAARIQLWVLAVPAASPSTADHGNDGGPEQQRLERAHCDLPMR